MIVRTYIDGPRRSGKTTELVKRVAKAAKHKDRNIAVITPMISASKVVYDMLLEEIPSKKIKRSIASPPAEINLLNGACIRFYTLNKSATHMHTVDDLFIDESTFIDTEAYWGIMQIATKTITETRLVEDNAGPGVLG